MTSLSLSILLLFILPFVLGRPHNDAYYQNEFTTWMHTYNKAYSEREFPAKFEAFKDTVDYIEMWNADVTHTHTLGLNSMSDLTLAEYHSLYLAAEKLTHPQPSIHTKKHHKNPPKHIDWREKGVVAPVKDQGACGSCWAFAATASVESAHAQATGNLTILSEQNLVDCLGAAPYTLQGCGGGDPYLALWYVKMTGIDSEISYPYTSGTTGVPGTCSFNKSNVGATIAGFETIPAGNETALSEVLGLVGPVSVCLDASLPSFQSYKGGIYHDPACSTTSGDHCLLAVGYTEHYYIIKNSWGTGWGINGYIHMARNRNNTCAVSSWGSYAVTNDATTVISKNCTSVNITQELLGPAGPNTNAYQVTVTNTGAVAEQSLTLFSSGYQNVTSVWVAYVDNEGNFYQPPYTGSVAPGATYQFGYMASAPISFVVNSITC